MFPNFVNESKQRTMKSSKEDPANYHEERIARNNIKRGATHAMFLGGPSPEEAKKKLKEKFLYTEEEVRRLEGGIASKEDL